VNLALIYLSYGLLPNREQYEIGLLLLFYPFTDYPSDRSGPHWPGSASLLAFEDRLLLVCKRH